MTADSQQIITAGDAKVKRWRAADGALIDEFSNDAGQLTRMTLSADGRLMLTAATDGRMRIRDLSSGELVRDIVADADLLWSASFNPDATRVAAAAGEESVSVWDLETGKQLATLTGHTQGATNVSFLADGVTLVVTDRTGALHWWDLHTQRRLDTPWAAHESTIWRMALHPDGTRFATAGDDGKVRLWDALSVEHACRIGSVTFDAPRRQRYFGEAEENFACPPPE